MNRQLVKYVRIAVRSGWRLQESRFDESVVRRFCSSARTTADDSLSLGCAIYSIFCDNTVTVFVIMCDGFLLNVSQNHHN